MIASQTTVYALRALLHLAERPDAQPVRVDDIATALEVPRNYLSKILHVLARRGLLRSARGPGGGFSMAKPPSRTTLLEVAAHFDDMSPGRCLLGRPECRDDNPCPAHSQWKEVATTLHAFFRDTTLADLARRPDAADRPDANPEPQAETDQR